MKRRQFLQSLLASTGAATLWPTQGLAQGSEYNGRFLVVIFAAGGWDVTSLCDPKMNVQGELEINRWARHSEILTAGNLQYAPFGENDLLFQKYRNYMLVINGVDTQTNAHDAGVVHSFSGRLSNGFPSLTALFASGSGPDLPISYINYGGYSETAGLTRYTRLSDAASLRRLLAPNIAWDDVRFLNDSEFAAVLAAHGATADLKLTDDSLLPRYRRMLGAHQSALTQTAELERFLDVIPDDSAIAEMLVDPGPTGPEQQPILQHAQLAVLAFKAGVACASDMIVHSLDTHARNDEFQEPRLGTLTKGVDYLWDYAEEQGIADRLTVVISSDFGRTPFYNSEAGKDHWPIGSYIIMEKNPSWGNRVVGLTDEGHNAHLINPDTLQRDDTGGTLIHPKHVHQALRTHLGLDNHPLISRFPFPNTETFDFFNPDKSTT